jgi:hypothetical protein
VQPPRHREGFPTGDGSDEEVLDMTAEVMSWNPMGKVDTGMPISREDWEKHPREREGSSRCGELFGAATLVGA